MTENNVASTDITPQVPGQEPAANQQVQGGGGTGISPEIEELIKQRVDRELQSRTDKLNNLIDAEVKKRLAATPEPTPQAQPNTAPPQATTSASVQASGSAPVQAPQEPDKSISWAIGFAEAMDKREGVSVRKDDPEAALVDVSDPLKFVETYPKAMAQKKARLAEEAKSTAVAATTLATGHGRPANPIADIWDIDDLYKQGLAKK